MRLRIEHIALVGTTREASFEPGLNVIQGGITTGKTTLMKLLRVLTGAGIPTLPPEVRQNVSALAGTLLVGDERVDVVRPLKTTTTAKVDLATASGKALRVPALQPDRTSDTTYGRWLLAQLGLPDLRVPTAPSKPDSDTSALSINDFTLYCRLSQDGIDSSVLGIDVNQNVKRRQVFEVLYGIYDARTAALEAERREVIDELRTLRAGAQSFERFLADTPWDNRAALEQQRSTARARLNELDDAQSQEAAAAHRTDRAGQLRAEAQRLDSELSAEQTAADRDATSVIELQELLAQLETQSARLTKSIVAGSRLYDLDFEVCPRCASRVEKGRADAEHCYLCLQEPQAPISRQDLIGEQERIVAQITETEELIARRRQAAEESAARVAALAGRRAEVGAELDRHQRDFVSDHADQIAARVRERAELDATLRRVDDYLSLYARLDASATRIAELEQRERELDAEIEQARSVEVGARERIDQLEQRFGNFVEAFGTPRFPGDPRAGIDLKTYNPILNGRSFEQLSSGGLKVLTNLAYALGHHVTAVDLGLPLPHLLLIDGVTKNVGRDEYDQARVDAVFDVLLYISDNYGEQLQIIVAANDVPAQAAHTVRLTLTETDRLIPAPDSDAGGAGAPNLG